MKNAIQDVIFYIKQNPLAFFGIFFVTVFVTYLFLYLIDFYPEPKTAVESEIEEVVVTSDDEVSLEQVEETRDRDKNTAQLGEEPTAITLVPLGRTVTVLNPSDASMATLERDLQKGVIRHPDSVLLGEKGNVVILGHSSYLPNVMNKNYQAFNGIQDFKWGDLISVSSGGKDYVYRVDRVYKATTDEVVPVAGDEQTLTLVTCNVFAGKEDRYILEATLKEVVGK